MVLRGTDGYNGIVRTQYGEYSVRIAFSCMGTSTGATSTVLVQVQYGPHILLLPVESTSLSVDWLPVDWSKLAMHLRPSVILTVFITANNGIYPSPLYPTRTVLVLYGYHSTRNLQICHFHLYHLYLNGIGTLCRDIYGVCGPYIFGIFSRSKVNIGSNSCKYE